MIHQYLDQVMMTEGQLIRAVNVDSFPVGAKVTRPGYTSFLNTSNGSQVNSLFSWTRQDGSSIFLYRFSGNTLQYYDVAVGTATQWLNCDNGTFTGGSHVGNAVLNDVLIVGDGINPTRHSTDGTSFTNTTLAPVGQFFTTYQGANGARVYIAGTASQLFYSVSGDATNWNLSGTSDSSSIFIPNDGRIGKLMVLSGQLLIGKSQGRMYRWDGANLYDLANASGPTSPYSFANIEGNGFWLNPLGVMTSQGDSPQLISNPVQRFIYNDANTGIGTGVFNNAPGAAHRYDYFLSIGSVQDDFTQEPLNNGILKYNYQKNEFLTYQFNDNPTAYHSFRDSNGQPKLIFGNAAGQCFTFGGTAVTDAGNPIYSVVDLLFNFNNPSFEKDWRWLVAYFNPGDSAQVSIAHSNTFDMNKKDWIDIGEARSGVVKFKFPAGARSRLLWMRIKDASRTGKFTFYGVALGAIVVDPG